MLNAQVRTLWNEQAGRLIRLDGSVDVEHLATVLKFAAANAPVADTANLFNLLDANPQLSGTLVPANMAPAGLPQLDVLTLNTSARVRPSPPAATVAVALPEAMRASLVDFATRAQTAAGDTLYYVAEGDAVNLCSTVAATATELLAMAKQPTPDLDVLLKKTKQVSDELSAARVASGEIANFVLGEEGDAILTGLADVETDVTQFRVSAVPSRAATLAPRAVPEWNPVPWVDVACVMDATEQTQTQAARGQALAGSDASGVDSSLMARFSDDVELFAAQEIAHFLIAEAAEPTQDDVASYLETVLPPPSTPRERVLEILYAAVESSVSHVRPALRVAGVAPGQEDYSQRVVPAPPAPAEPVVEPVAPVSPSDPVQPVAVDAIEVGDTIEWFVEAGVKKRAKVAAVVPVTRTVNGEATGTIPFYITDGGEQVEASMGVAKVKTSVSPLYVPTPAFDVVPPTPPRPQTVRDLVGMRDVLALAGEQPLSVSSLAAMHLLTYAWEEDQTLAATLAKAHPTKSEVAYGFNSTNAEALSRGIVTAFKLFTETERQSLIDAGVNRLASLSKWVTAYMNNAPALRSNQATATEQAQAPEAQAAASEKQVYSVGDWIEFVDPITKKTHQDMICRVWQITAGLNSGRGISVSDEYSMLTGGTCAQKDVLQAIEMPEISASKATAMFLCGSIGSNDDRKNLAKLLGRCTPTEVEIADCGFNPANIQANQAFAAEVLAAFRGVKEPVRLEMKDLERRGQEEPLTRWCRTKLLECSERTYNQGAGEVPREESATAHHPVAAVEALPLVNTTEKPLPLVEPRSNVVRRARGRLDESAAPQETELADLDLPEGRYEEAATVGSPSTSPVVRPEDLGIEALSFHQGKFKVWFKTEVASKRDHPYPWDTTLPAKVVRGDYELVARVEGAHITEVFTRLQSGLVGWSDATDPGAKVVANMDANGHLRRRSMEFGDLVQDESNGQIFVVNTEAFNAIEGPEEGLTPLRAPSWEPVSTRQGFGDPLEFAGAPAPSARSGRRGR